MSSKAMTKTHKAAPSGASSPRHRAHAPHAGAQAHPELTITSCDRPITILLVDDDADCRMLIRDAIAECKVSNDVHEVATAEAALDFLNRRGRHAQAPRPGLVYLDIEMPGMNGLEALRQIRANPQLREIPVVMMTGLCGEEEMRLAAQYGANSYTVKPANAEQFLRTVLASTTYWLTIHQQPDRHIDPKIARK